MAVLRSNGSIALRRLSSLWLRSGMGVVENRSVVESSQWSGEGLSCAGLNRVGRRCEGIHSDASAGGLDHYKVAVVGAGPAGLAVVSTLLDHGCTSILWIDPRFNSGRLSSYTEVPSNTKVKLFQQFVTTSPTLNRFASQALEHYNGQDPDRGCSLSLAVRMVKTLTDCIRQQDVNRVRCSENVVKELSFLDGKWHIDSGEVVDQVYLVTGSMPSKYDTQSGVEDIHLDLALKPSSLAGLVSECDTVGVVGSSHSAMLALRNLVDCKVQPKKIINFYRSPLLYAQYMDNWILYDNTGLKGEVAEWAVKEVDTGNLEDKGIVTRVCVKGLTLDEQIAHWQRCTKLIQAVGFCRNVLPKITVIGQELVDVKYDPLNGRIADGLFGYGIAFPEQTTDPYGNRELAVGLWKFMRYARATIPTHFSHLL
ncbi:monooxygenase AgnR1 isoform X1 [Physcomitrium patens]|uniref:FAD/NAD(P)-binding domain-containing protein n=1 Tax=Physcomitrium patens TaxID=3218 RepID=A0A2K1JQ06_PHYPA|nr:uncharacterized protein LOC112289596 isoform X1 [Physcomitrium patens]PNR43629.1 hypothetical protein PHYPA_016010 [Physcomitrium patens]|eukprot:XP_024390698.1 uncharacterized protein LOC112289596 isoform X1 [Physcomitrella patens]